MSAPTWSRTCTTLDHVYPVTKFGKPCYCGARVWGGRKPEARVIPTPIANDEPRADHAVVGATSETFTVSLGPMTGRLQSEDFFETSEKVVDIVAVDRVVLQEQDEPRGARGLVTGATAPQPKDKTVQLTLKGLSKNGKVALYTGAANVLRIPVGAFGSGNEAPATIDVSGVAEKPAKVEKVKLTPEERKAARAAKPKPTLAEKAAAARKRAEALEAKAAAEAGQPSL